MPLATVLQKQPKGMKKRNVYGFGKRKSDKMICWNVKCSNEHLNSLKICITFKQKRNNSD